MTRYIGCETARELLDEFVDGELPMADQVMVEAHLRWCRTCRKTWKATCRSASGE